MTGNLRNFPSHKKSDRDVYACGIEDALRARKWHGTVVALSILITIHIVWPV